MKILVELLAVLFNIISHRLVAERTPAAALLSYIPPRSLRSVGWVTLLLVATPSCSLAEKPDIRLEADSIVMETSVAEYRVGLDGDNRSLVNKDDGMNYLSETPAEFMRVHKDGKPYRSTAVVLVGDVLEVTFGSSGVRAWIKVIAKPEWIVYEVVRTEGTFDSLRLLNLGMDLKDRRLGAIVNACFDDEFGVSIQALNLNIDSRPYDRVGNSLVPEDFVEAGRQYFQQPNSVILTATLFPQLPIDGSARVAVVTAPGEDLKGAISRLELETGLPHPRLDGVWGKVSPEISKSYIFVDFGEADVDEVIRYAKSGGFQYIVTHPFITSGHYLVDPQKFPNGMEGLKKAVEKIHKAGLKAGLHTNTGGIAFDDPYVTPVPHEHLAKSAVFELADVLDSVSSLIPILTSPAGLPNKHNYRLYGPGLHLQIGQEIIQYSDHSDSEPYAFVGCRRGVLGTTPTAHKKGANVYHLAEKWNHFTLDVRTPLLTEVAGRLADILNDCEFDWLYLDGAEILSAQGPAFYNVNRFVFDLFSKVTRDLLIQSSFVDNLTLHVVSRQTSNDFPFYGIRKYFDVIRIDAVNFYEDNLCPTELGWWGFVLNNESHVSTLPEEIEYGCAKTIAYDRAISLQLYQKRFLDQHGRTDEILELLKEYEDLRLRSYFPQSVREKLKEPGCDYKLFRDDGGRRYFKKIKYGPRQYIRGGGEPGQWQFTNEFERQPLAVRIRATHTPAEFADPRNIPLIRESDMEKMESASANGLGGSLDRSSDSTPWGGPSLSLTATNHTDTRSSWHRETLYLPSQLNLSNHRMLGAWVHGDASGALLNFQLGIPRGTTIDHYVDLGFEGWKYLEFPWPEGDRVFDYEWPYLWKHSLVSLRWREVDRIALYLNAIPARTKTTCRIGPVKALRLIESNLTNPSISIGDKRITFPVVLEQDEYLEFYETGSFKHFDADGHLLDIVPIAGEVPEVASGRNEILFDAESTGRKTGSAIVTIVTTGPRLEESRLEE